MGMIKELQPFFYRCIKHADIKFKGLKMCELGNQSYQLPDGKQITAKEFFTSKEVQHTSIDWNGKDGVLSIDMNKPITDARLLNGFDVITNIGMTEHVENQYQCFKNIHNLCKTGGYFIHMVPIFYYWADKNNLWFYYPSFFRGLAVFNHYIVSIEGVTSWGKNRNQDLLSVLIKKLSNNEFTSMDKFASISNRRVGTKIDISKI